MSQQHFTKSNFSQWERFYRASFFNSLGGFKSLNLMASRSDDGINNAGLFFSVTHVGANPPYLGLLFRPHTVPRHSLENFRASGFATINSVNTELLQKAHAASANFSAEESEFELLDIPLENKGFPAPYVKDSPIQIGISHLEEHLIKANGTIFVVAAIEEVHIDDRLILDDGLIDHSLADGITVNGLDSYYTAERYKRYSYARPHEELKELKWDKK